MRLPVCLSTGSAPIFSRCSSRFIQTGILNLLQPAGGPASGPNLKVVGGSDSTVEQKKKVVPPPKNKKKKKKKINFFFLLLKISAKLKSPRNLKQFRQGFYKFCFRIKLEQVMSLRSFIICSRNLKERLKRRQLIKQ